MRETTTAMESTYSNMGTTWRGKIWNMNSWGDDGDASSWMRCERHKTLTLFDDSRECLRNINRAKVFVLRKTLMVLLFHEPKKIAILRVGKVELNFRLIQARCRTTKFFHLHLDYDSSELFFLLFFLDDSRSLSGVTKHTGRGRTRGSKVHMKSDILGLEVSNNFFSCSRQLAPYFVYVYYSASSSSSFCRWNRKRKKNEI